MRDRDITFVPASGRQYYTLEALFARAPQQLSYIAENGNLIAHDGELKAVGTVDDAVTADVITTVRAATDGGRDLGLVVCGVGGGYVERDDHAFISEADKYYLRLDHVDDLTAVDDQILKLAVYDFDDAETARAEYFDHLSTGSRGGGDGSAGGRDLEGWTTGFERVQAVVSGKNWIDFMSPGIDKGVGVRALQNDLGITPAQTAVFGDYLNDLQMLDAGEWSYAMANAHPDVKARARYEAPSNTDEGVLVVLRELMGL